ncbi:MAG: hypothetical protein H7Z40_20660 [Phycisphaerae bacterium]|nr:hypothetical protein [Gemmatimonadaceae bacterium]
MPTVAPIVEQRWIVPGETSRIAVATLLPAGVSILPDSSGFTVTASMATVARPLSADCALCVIGNGSTGVKPAMVVNASMSTQLASDIASATLTGGSIALSITNNYTFDPLRPNGNVGPFGSATITVSSGSNVLGTLKLDGSAHALSANGGKMDVNIPLAGGVSGTTPVSVTMSVTSPEGVAVTMDANRTITVNATPTNLKVANALVSVAGRTLSSTSDVDFSDIGDGISDRTQKGALLLNIDNPFAVTSSLSVKLQPEGGDLIVKSVPLGTGKTSHSIEFSREELKKLFGHKVRVTISGLANASAGPVSVTPKQAVVVTTRFDLTLSVGN